MILAIDIGNTTIAFYVVSKEPFKVHETIKLPTNKDWGDKEYIGLLRESTLASYEIKDAILSSVVPSLTGVIVEATEAFCGHAPKVISIEDNEILSFQVEDEKKLGIDRWVDAIGAMQCGPLPIITVDMGTATTINVIDKDKVFLGGLIAPGVVTAMNALTERAEQLPKVPIQMPDSVIGRNTLECIQAGGLFGATAMIDGIVQRIERELGSETTLIITGGLADIIHDELAHEHIYEPYLLVKGMIQLM